MSGERGLDDAGKMPALKIVMFGDFSGRNLGHDALLAALLDHVSALGASRITVPTLRPGALRGVLGERPGVDPLGVAPWHGALKFHGPRVTRAVDRADLVLLVDNQLHEKGLGNPLRGNLPALLALTARARRRGIPVVYLHGSLGPLEDRRARTLAAELARRMDLVLLRDMEALNGLAGLAPEVPAAVTADAGFALRPEAARPPEAAGGAIAVNLTAAALESGFDAWAAALSDLRTRLGRELRIVATHPADRAAADRLAQRLGRGVTRLDPTSAPLSTCLRELTAGVGCAIGDRYHELVMFAALGIPVVGATSGDKVAGLLGSLEMAGCGFDPVCGCGPAGGLDAAVEAALAGEDRLRQAVEARRATLTSSLTILRRVLRRAGA